MSKFRPPRRSGWRAPWVSGVLAVLVAAALAGAGAAAGAQEAAPGGEPTTTVADGGSVTSVPADDATSTTAAGAKIVLDVSNADPTQHNFTFGDLEISKNIPPDTSALIRFTAPKPGRYRFYCKYHQQEMQGWLTVK